MQMVRANPLLIQVVPRLQPGRCGVTDHVIPLAEELKAAFGIDTAFVVLNSEERCELQFQVVYCKPDRLLASSLELSGNKPGAMLVHVSGYGYSADGAPTVLAKAEIDNMKIKYSEYMKLFVLWVMLLSKKRDFV